MSGESHAKSVRELARPLGTVTAVIVRTEAWSVGLPWFWYHVAKFDESALRIVLQVTQNAPRFRVLLERSLRFRTSVGHGMV
jgi:hypothetical protein